MKKTGRCPKCGATEIIANAKAVDSTNSAPAGTISIATFRDPDALFFKGMQQTTLSAWVCTSCGYIEFYADDPAKIKLPAA
jgi:predicted nucleic-acid-binding Zn-ribbon protein